MVFLTIFTCILLQLLNENMEYKSYFKRYRGQFSKMLVTYKRETDARIPFLSLSAHTFIDLGDGRICRDGKESSAMECWYLLYSSSRLVLSGVQSSDANPRDDTVTDKACCCPLSLYLSLVPFYLIFTLISFEFFVYFFVLYFFFYYIILAFTCFCYYYLIRLIFY